MGVSNGYLNGKVGRYFTVISVDGRNPTKVARWFISLIHRVLYFAGFFPLDGFLEALRFRGPGLPKISMPGRPYDSWDW